jgi:hypothetical protein
MTTIRKLYYSVYAADDSPQPEAHTFDTPDDALSELGEWLVYDHTPQDSDTFTFKYTLEVHTNPDKYVY